jgi:DNA-binding CsgD family transcriptional regulator
MTFKDRLLVLFSDVETVTESGLNTTEHIFLTLAARLAPWLAPLGPAILIYRALTDVLGLNPIAAGAMGAAVELVGIATSHLTVNCWQWNQQRRKSDPEAPTKLAAGMTAVYFLGAVGVSTILEIYPAASDYVPIVFFLLAVCAYGSLALGSQLNRWQATRRAEADERRAKSDRTAELTGQVKVANNRVIALAKQVEKLTIERDKLTGQLAALTRQFEALTGQNNDFGPHNLPAANQARWDNVTDRRESLIQIIEGNPDLTNGQLADVLGVSESTVKNDKRALNGRLKGNSHD